MPAEFGGWGNRMIRKVGDLCGSLEMGTKGEIHSRWLATDLGLTQECWI